LQIIFKGKRDNILSERIKPTNDLAFKKTFGSEDNKDILSGLISDFFGFSVPAQEISLDNPYSIDAYKAYLKGEDVIELRQTIKDISASFQTANFISELQVSKTRYYDERALYYPFDRFCKNYSKSGHMETSADGRPNRYSSLRPVYSLNILGYNHFEDDDALRIFEMYDPARNKRYGKELMRIGFFELSKGSIETEIQTHWRDYFLTGEVKPEAPEYIKKASRIIELVNLSEEEREMATLLERAQAEYDAGISGAYHDGKDEGRIEGRIEGKAEGIDFKAKETAKNMLRKGYDPAEIAELTGLTLDAIRALR
jgi:predicted transposase/invertase (TIGR01784 family)